MHCHPDLLSPTHATQVVPAVLGTVAIALAVACVVLVAEQGRVVMESGLNMRAKENAFFDMLAGPASSTLEATQGQIDGFCSQLPYKCHQNRVASVGD